MRAFVKLLVFQRVAPLSNRCGAILAAAILHLITGCSIRCRGLMALDHLLSVTARFAVHQILNARDGAGPSIWERPHLRVDVFVARSHHRTGQLHQRLRLRFVLLGCRYAVTGGASVFISAPSGTAAVSRYFQSSIRSLRASATMPIRLSRLPPFANRCSNHFVSALVG
jgi:hypothetical protein